MRFPVSVEELVKNYDEVMPEIDRLALERRAEVWRAWPEFVQDAGSWECLRKLHVVMFGGLFDFAGKIRTHNISKGGFRFANVLFLNEILPIIAKMPQSSFEEITAKYVEMNIAHPFSDGNGRVTRLWLDAMLERELHTRVDWTQIRRDDYMEAMRRSLVNTTELEVVLKKSMLAESELDNEDTFLAGLTASYKYEM